MIKTELVSEAARRYNAGENITKIRSLLGGTLPEVRQALVDAGCVIRSRGRPPANGGDSRRSKIESVSQIKKMYEEDGLTVYEIADKLNTGHQNVSHYMYRNGCPLSSLTRPSKPFTPTMRQVAIIEDYEAGMLPDAICKNHKISKGQLQSLREKMGVARQPAGFYMRADNYDERNAEVVRRYLNGEVATAIMADMGLKPSYFYHCLACGGITPNRHKITEAGRREFIKKVKTLKAAGKTHKEIKDELGIGLTTIQRYAKL